jgi:hypothetical protein
VIERNLVTVVVLEAREELAVVGVEGVGVLDEAVCRRRWVAQKELLVQLREYAARYGGRDGEAVLQRLEVGRVGLCEADASHVLRPLLAHV